jgi:hypothetical protein
VSIRRLIVVIVVLAGLTGAILASRTATTAQPASFGPEPFASRPYASHNTPITSTWFCPGVPGGSPGLSGAFVVTNPSDVAITGRALFYGPEGTAPATAPVTVPGRDSVTVEAADHLAGEFVAAMVELDGGEGMVEQVARHPAGTAVASCAPATAPDWYFADGWTVDDSTEQLVIANPYSDTAIVDVTFFTKSGTRQPSAFQADSIAPRSLKVINVAQSGLVDEQVIGVHVSASRGRLVVERGQHYVGGGRLGYSLLLGSPTTSSQVWFAYGEQGKGITEQYAVLNPTEDDVEVTPTVLGVPLAPEAGFVPPEAFSVPANSVVTFDMANVQGLPDGLHTMVFGTLADASIVVERVLTRPAGDLVATSVVLGMTSEYVVHRWYVPVGVDAATEGALVVYNLVDEDATVAVKAIGPGGEVGVPGVDDLALPANGLITIDLTDPSVFGRPLVVESTQSIFVERRLPRGGDLPGRSGSWALPECGPSACSFFSPPA